MRRPSTRLKIRDYQPAIEAGMAEQLKEVDAIANNPAPPTFENTFVPLEKSGRLLAARRRTFFGVVGANSNPELLKIRSIEAPKLAAHSDEILLNAKLFARIAAIYQQRNSLHLDPEALRLVEWRYLQFMHAGANLNDADKTELKKLNEQIATLSDDFQNKLLAATKDGALCNHRQSGARRTYRSADQRRCGSCQTAQSRGLRYSFAEHHAAARSGDAEQSRHAADDL